MRFNVELTIDIEAKDPEQPNQPSWQEVMEYAKMMLENAGAMEEDVYASITVDTIRME